MLVSFLKDKTDIYRRVDAIQNEYGEPMNVSKVIEHQIKCRVEKIFEKEILEAYGGGDTDKAIYVVYFKPDVNLKVGDELSFCDMIVAKGFLSNIDGDFVKSGVDDRGNSIYTHKSGLYLILYDVNNWILTDNANNTIATTSELKFNGVTYWYDSNQMILGRSYMESIKDFALDKIGDVRLLVLDIEGVGGTKLHHLECMCRLRQQIE
jgi:hypothetical protein